MSSPPRFFFTFLHSKNAVSSWFIIPRQSIHQRSVLDVEMSSESKIFHIPFHFIPSFWDKTQICFYSSQSSYHKLSFADQSRIRPGLRRPQADRKVGWSQSRRTLWVGPSWSHCSLWSCSSCGRSLTLHSVLHSPGNKQHFLQWSYAQVWGFTSYLS